MLTDTRRRGDKFLPPTGIGITALLLILVLFGSVNAAQAQVSAAISGRVEDASGAAVTGATVIVKSLETEAVRTVSTDEAGNFRVLGLAIGPQEVKAEKKGFKSTVRTGINLQVGQEAVVNLTLQVGELIQQIVVSEETPVVNTTTAPVSGMVGEHEVKDLPLNGRSFDNLITLNPGAINFGAMKSPQTSTSNGNTFTVAGRRTAENLFMLNGVEYTGSSQLAITPGGVSGQLLGIDAVREFNVLTDTYSAEYGKRAGAQINVVTQSGSNALHGSIFEFLRNSALDATSYFATQPAPPFKQNQFGAAAGGPLERDRWFLFGNYEGFRQALTVSNVAVVPDANARQGILPFGPCSATSPCTSMLPYMAFWPEPNGPELLVPTTKHPSGTAYSYNSPKQHIREDFATLRTDYALRDRDSLSVAYTVDDGNSLVPLGDPLFASYSALRMQVASVQETHIFSPNFLNTFHAGFSRAGFSLDSVPQASFPANLSFLVGAGPGGIVIGGGATTTGLAALTSAGPNNASGVWNRRNLFTYADDVQISKGIHQITFGAWLQRLQDNEDSASRQLGQATFTTLTSFLQGTVSNLQIVPDPTALGWRSLFGAWYVEDAIRLRPRFTIRVGLRHEFTTGWNEESGRAGNYIVGPSGILLTSPQIGNSIFTQNNAKRLFSPRVGLAWDVFGNGRTAVRAGFGTYYSLIDDLAFLMNSLPPYNGALTFSGPFSSFRPLTPGVPPPPSCGPGVPAPCSIFAPQGVQADAKTPTVEAWSLTIEQELNKSTAFRVAYVGSHGYHGFLSLDPNTIPAQICSDPAGCAAGGVLTNCKPVPPAAPPCQVPQGTEYIPVGTRPNQYLGAGFFWFTQGNSSYNALETELTHRLNDGLHFRANYTWSKNLDVNSALTGAQANNQPQMVMNRNDLRRDWGLSALNVTSQASISATYELPFGRGKQWFSAPGGLEGKLISGWQLNGIATFLSGFPFTPLVGSNRSGDGDTRNPDRPSLNPSFSGPVVLHNPKEWFDPGAFALPPAGTFGTLRRGTFTGPGLANVDFSVFKNTVLTEGIDMEFRAEFFNLFNRANFGPPNTTVFASGGVSAAAGLITNLATNPRQIQFGLKLIF